MLLFWQTCTNQLQKDLTPQQFKAWIAPLRVSQYNEQTHELTVLAPSRIKAEACARQFGQKISTLAQQYWSAPVQVNFSVVDKTKINPSNPEQQGLIPTTTSNAEIKQTEHPESSTMDSQTHSESNPTLKSKKLNSRQKNTQNSAHDQNNEQGSLASTEATNNPSNVSEGENKKNKTQSNPAYKHTGLDKGLNLDTLVTGNANQMARMVGLEIIKDLGTRYNPFFIYGGVGVGKTHLMHAIGNEVQKLDPNKKIRYLFANTYVSEVVKAYQKNQFEDFKNYYHNLDLLLIDDIQFFGEGEKSGTQAAFFELFESLIRNQKQIIITSDRYPKSLEGIQERLRSRFMSGIDIAIDPPEFEMRVSILLKKADLDGVALSEEVAIFIAQLLRANVRELEGALRKVIAYARFNNAPIDIHNTKLALKDLLINNQEHISIEAIQKAVADFYKIKVSDMYSAKRPKLIAVPRQIAMYLAKELTQKSLPEIGANFGGRDHTTVLYACRKIKTNKLKDTKLQHELHVLEQILKS